MITVSSAISTGPPISTTMSSPVAIVSRVISCTAPVSDTAPSTRSPPTVSVRITSPDPKAKTRPLSASVLPELISSGAAMLPIDPAASRSIRLPTTLAAAAGLPTRIEPSTAYSATSDGHRRSGLPTATSTWPSRRSPATSVR